MKGPLSQARYGTNGATGNASFGYFGGGYNSSNSPTSLVDRIDYSSDTATASPKGPLSSAGNYKGATGTSTHGYFAGHSNQTVIDRVDYSNDTATASPRGNLSRGRAYMGATGARENGFDNILGPALVENTVTPVYPITVFGYFRTNSYDVNKFNFANDTAPGTHLSNQLTSPSGASGKSMAYSSSSYAYFSRDGTVRIDYSNDTAAFVSVGGMPTARYEGAAVQNLTHGYVLGGFATSVYRLDFANDTATMSTRGNLADSRREFGAAGNLTHAYTMGDGDAMKIDYSNDTATAVFLNPTVSGAGNSYATGSITHGYLAYGQYIQRYDYSNDTATGQYNFTQFGSSMGTNGAASGNASFGYFVAPSGTLSQNLHRLQFANDTVTPKVKTLLANSTDSYGSGTSISEFGLRQ